MATPAEKKALLFLGVVTLLGGAVRLWRSQSADAKPPSQEQSRELSRTSSRSSGSHASTRSASKPRTPRRSPSNPKHTLLPSALVDLDVATVDDLEALGVLKPGVARMIVANRDSFGPFGSLRTLARVPHLRKTTITSLAPLVTFSRVPRPINTVLSQRADSAPPSTRRRSPSSKHR